MFRNIYQDFGDGMVDCWNAVDVKSDDGLLQHGTVVDVLSAGILVDFGYSGHRQHFIPYGQAFQVPEEDKFQWTKIPEGAEVIALLREQFDSPWIWYPAKLLATFQIHNGRKLTLVGLELRGVYREEIVPAEQLRMPPSPTDLEASIIQAGHFDRRVCVLSDCDDWSSAADGTVLKLIPVTLSRMYKAHLILLSKTHLVYFQRTTTTALDSDILNMVTDLAQREIVLMNQEGMHYTGAGWRCYNFPRRALNVKDSKESDVSLLHVRKDVLGEVFQYATSMGRVQYRRVCPLFDEIVKNRTRFTDIVIHYRTCPAGFFSECRRCGSYGKEHLVVAPLVKCMTSNVKHIIITAENDNEDVFPVRCLLNALHRLYTLNRTDRRSLVVVAGNCSFFDGGAFHVNVQELAQDLQTTSVCSKLLVKNCSVKQ